jgi:hypothetical protein
LVLFALVAVAACGQSQNRSVSTEQLSTYDVAEEPPPARMRSGAVQATAPAAAPQIAYTYSFGYTVSPAMMSRPCSAPMSPCAIGSGPHAAASPQMSRDSGDGRFVQAGLTLLVDARIARQFGDRLDAAVSGAGGEVSQRGIEAEDLSKQIVDTEARMRGKEALAQRLLALLGSRQGKVGELVEAERAYAQAQEELDAARSWLAEMRGRVAHVPAGDQLYEPAAGRRRLPAAGAGRVARGGPGAGRQPCCPGHLHRGAAALGFAAVAAALDCPPPRLAQAPALARRGRGQSTGSPTPPA